MDTEKVAHAGVGVNSPLPSRYFIATNWVRDPGGDGGRYVYHAADPVTRRMYDDTLSVSAEHVRALMRAWWPNAVEVMEDGTALVRPVGRADDA